MDFTVKRTSALTTYGNYGNHLLTDHLPTTYRPLTDHLPTTYWPLTDHFFTVQLVHDYLIDHIHVLWIENTSESDLAVMKQLKQLKAQKKL